MLGRYDSKFLKHRINASGTELSEMNIQVVLLTTGFQDTQGTNTCQHLQRSYQAAAIKHDSSYLAQSEHKLYLRAHINCSSVTFDVPSQTFSLSRASSASCTMMFSMFSLRGRNLALKGSGWVFSLSV